MDVSIRGKLCLGEYPVGFAQLARNIQTLPSVRPPPIVMDCAWFDLTMLGYLALVLRSCRKRESAMTIQFPNRNKIPFLWRSGFISESQIGHRGSPFKVVPDIWNEVPSDLSSRANFTPLIPLDISRDQSTEDHLRGYSLAARDAAHSLLTELEKTDVYHAVSRTELMESREYLHIVLWELVQNAIDHSEGTNAVIAAQLFCKRKVYEDERSNYALRAQHGLEEANCATTLRLRREWLEANREGDYLMLTCVDKGVGIPATVKKKTVENGFLTDIKLLQSSFQRESSDHDTFGRRYAIHGLHLIAQLVSSYQGYLFVQSGAAIFEKTKDDENCVSLDEVMRLEGTSFQVLLPLTAGEPSRYFKPQAVSAPRQLLASYVFATEELRKHTFRLPPSRGTHEEAVVVDGWVRSISSCKGTLFLDFAGMPRERHFISALLLSVRRKKTDSPTIILNASEELFTAVKGLRSPDGDTSQIEELREIDRALATDLTRGEGPSLLPLVVAVTRLRDSYVGHLDEKLAPPGIAAQWLGIGDTGPHTTVRLNRE